MSMTLQEANAMVAKVNLKQAIHLFEKISIYEKHLEEFQEQLNACVQRLTPEQMAEYLKATGHTDEGENLYQSQRKRFHETGEP